MKRVRVISISLGSSRRDYTASVDLAGVNFAIERRGTDGSIKSAADMMAKVAPNVDAIGLGGVNLAYRLGRRTYGIKEGRILAECAEGVPVVDGSLAKEFWEPELIRKLIRAGRLDVAGKQALISSVLDRYPLAACLHSLGAKVRIGDAMLALKLPIIFPSIATFSLAAVITMPVLRHLPLKYLYPLGQNQHIRKTGLAHMFEPMQIIAGDFHLINRYLPQDLHNKTILTSTLTGEDRRELKARGAAQIVTLGITVGDRSFGANVVDAMISGAAKVGAFATHDCGQVLNILLAESSRESMTKLAKI